MPRTPRAPTLYRTAEHESLLAVGRCLRLHRGAYEANRLFAGLLDQFKAESVFELSPFGANFCRKMLEPMLPLYGDFAG